MQSPNNSWTAVPVPVVRHACASASASASRGNIVVPIHPPVLAAASAETDADVYCACCIAASTCCGMIVLIGGAIILTIFSIVGLVNNWNEGVECGLAQFVIVSLIIKFLIGGSFSGEDTLKSLCALCFRQTVTMSISIWGIVTIVNSVDCSVYDTTLWWSGLFMVILDVLVMVLIVVAMVIASRETFST